MEAKRLGDMAVTEGWAMLMQHLVTEPAWLNRRLDVPRPADLAYDGAVSLLYFVRRYCAKLLYELEFFQADDLLSMRGRYHEILSDALKLPVNPESYLDDIDGSFYVIGYLRSWAFEAQLREFLRGEFGNEWFARRDAGDLLRELWSLGRARRPTSCSRTSRARSSGWLPSQIGCARVSAPDARTRRPADRLDGARCRRRARRALRPLRRCRVRRRAADPARPGLAQDAVQDAFLAAWRTAPHSTRARERVDLAADTRAPARRRPRAPRGAAPRDVLDESAPVASGDSTDEAAEVRAQRRAVQAALAQLPADQREALELAYYGGLSQSQLAERLGIPLGTVKSRMFTGARDAARLARLARALTLACCRSSTTSRPGGSRSSATR